MLDDLVPDKVIPLTKQTISILKENYLFYIQKLLPFHSSPIPLCARDVFKTTHKKPFKIYIHISLLFCKIRRVSYWHTEED
jgi:hypothetical protein